MIELVDITVRRGDRVLLWDIHATIPNAAVTVVTGRAGVGKSALMRVLRREVSPSQGEILLDRLPLSLWLPNQVSLRCAFLPQRSVLHFPFSVRDVVELGRIPRLNLCDRHEHVRIVELALEWLSIGHLAYEPYAALPAADQKRVQLARVLAQVLDADDTPPIHWTLDEPTAHLDDMGLDAFERVVKMLVQRGACIVLAIRDPRLASRFAQQLLVMEDGTFVAESTHATPMSTLFFARAGRHSSRGNA